MKLWGITACVGAVFLLTGCMVSDEAKEAILAAGIGTLETQFLAALRSMLEAGQITAEQLILIHAQFNNASAAGYKAAMAVPVATSYDWLPLLGQIGGLLGIPGIGAVVYASKRRRAKAAQGGR